MPEARTRQRPAGAGRQEPKAEGRGASPPGLDAKGRLVHSHAILRGQIRRTKGWRMPEGTNRKVDRTTPLGNPFSGDGAALVFFDWLVGAIEVPANGEKPTIPAAARYSTLRHGHYDLTEEGIRSRDRDGNVEDVGGTTLFPSLGWSSIKVSGWTAKELAEKRETIALAIKSGELAGVTLFCWCDPAKPCHADALSILANRPGRSIADLRVALAMRWNLPQTFSKWWRR